MRKVNKNRDENAQGLSGVSEPGGLSNNIDYYKATNKDVLSTIVLAIILFLALMFLFSCVHQNPKPSIYEQEIRKVAEFNFDDGYGTVSIYAVTIDSVDYVLAKTYNGITIIPKVVTKNARGHNETSGNP